MSASVRFGWCVPIFANPGMAFFRTPCYEHLDWETTRAAVLEAEALGFDSLFVADHVFLGREGAIYEGWTVLSALAGMTRSVRLAPIHLCDSFRHPPLVAKQVATLDVISGGRFLLFYDYGWRRAEFDAYGFAFEDSDDARARKMVEGLEIILSMLTRPHTSYTGRFYSVRDAVCEPKPLQRPRPPVWLGEANHPIMLEAVARHADVFNSMPVSVEGFEQKWRAVAGACEAIGRDPGSLGRSLETQLLVCESDAEIDGVFERIERLRPAEESDADILAQMKATNPTLGSYTTRADYEEEFVIGTPARVVERLREYQALGITHFMLWFMDYPDRSGMRLFAREVMPCLR